VLRKKWKYLRDQFSVEFGKIKPPRSGDPGCKSYEPKWPHYRSLLFLKDIVKPRGLSRNLTWDNSSPVQSNPIPSNDKTVNSVRGESCDHDDRGESVAFNENDSEDLRFTQYGTHNGNQDDGEVDSQDRSLVQDNPRKRKRHGVNARYNETIIAIEKQKAKFLEEAMKNRQPENEDLLFFRSLFAPRQQHTSQYKTAFQKPHPTSCRQVCLSSSFFNIPALPICTVVVVALRLIYF